MERASNREKAFVWENLCRHASYQIEEQDGVRVITSINDTNIYHYDPLKIETYYNRPDRRDGHRELSPAHNLASLNPEDEQQIVDFANRWGLLGLSKVDRYRLALINEVSLPEREIFPSYEGDYSAWYHHPHKKGFYRWQEPVTMFVAATIEYQMVLESLENVFNQTETENFLLMETMRGFFRGIHPALSWQEVEKKWIPGWQYSTLLHSIYLQLFLDSQANKTWKRCKYRNCRNFFLTSNPQSVYCSTNCASSQSKYDSRDRKIIDQICDKYPQLDQNRLKVLCKSILDESGIGKTRLEKRIKEIIEKGDLS